MTSALLEAWATGWASVDHPDAFPIPTEALTKARVAVEAADTFQDPAVVPYVIEAGATLANATVNHRARLKLYSDHRKLIVAAAAPLLAKVDTTKLAQSLLLLAHHDRKVRSAQAYSTIRSAVYGATGNTDKWQATNTAAAAAAAILGQATAAASPGPGLTPNPKVIAQHVSALVADHAATPAMVGLSASSDWIDQQVGALAWSLSPETVITSPDPAAAVKDKIDSGQSIGDQAEDAMHAWLSGGYKTWLINHNVTEMWWQTEEDQNVCPACEENEAESPFDPSDPDLPEMGAHPSCRCFWG